MAGEHYIADVYAGHHLSDKVQAGEGHANARLIAAAPETACQRDALLEALERILPVAIGHAKDATDIGSFTDDHEEDEWPWVQRARAAIADAKGEGS